MTNNSFSIVHLIDDICQKFQKYVAFVYYSSWMDWFPMHMVSYCPLFVCVLTGVFKTFVYFDVN